MEVADKIRKAVPEDLSRIGSALGRAFFDDPLFVWAIQNDDRRQRFELEFFTLYAKAFLRHDETYTTGGEVVAAALWAPPGAEPVSGEDAEELGRLVEELAGPEGSRFLDLKELAGPEGSRFLDLTKLFDDHHPHGSYWYLQFMGVTPGWQSQGIGAALMAPMLERCDREGVRAYLDATSERNKGLYERHGFEAKDPFAAPGGPPVWPMWRQPASGR